MPTDRSEEDFIEEFAHLLEREGGPRNAGRVAALLLLSAEPLALEEIADRVQASKASVCTNARLLEQWGLIEQTTHLGDRRDYYRARGDAAERLLERRLAWMERLGQVAEAGAHSPAARNPIVQERFRSLCRLHQYAVQNAERMLRALRSRSGGARP